MKEIEDVWPIVRSGLESEGVFCQRIESAVTDSGIFDVNCTWGGVEFWLELKAEMRELRPAQKAWAIRKAKAGGKVTILNMSRDSKNFILAGSMAELHLYSVNTGVIQGKYPHTPDVMFRPPYPWKKIRQYLTTSP